MFHRVKSFARVHSKKGKLLYNLGYPIKVAVDPTLNWQERISTVSTFSVGKLSGAEVSQAWQWYTIFSKAYNRSQAEQKLH